MTFIPEKVSWGTINPRRRRERGRVYGKPDYQQNKKNTPQFSGAVTPPSKIHNQSTQQRELKPAEPHALRRQPSERRVVGPQDGCDDRARSERRASEPATFEKRKPSSVVLW